MNAKPNPAAIGAFVIGAIALLILAALLLGGGSLFERNFECIAYFDEDISGLDIGAPVEYEGVRIGKVTGVSIELNLETGAFYRPVRFTVEPARISTQGQIDVDSPELLDRLVDEQGLRAQLAGQSLLTGKLKITLGNHPDTPIRLLARDSGTDLVELPTTPSPLATVANKLSDLPFADIVTELRDAVAGLRGLVDDIRTNGTVAHLDQSVQQLGALLASLEGKVTPLAEDGSDLLRSATAVLEDLRPAIQTASTDLAPLLANLNTSFIRLDAMLDPAPGTPAGGGEIPSLLADLREAARSLRLFLDYLEQHPEALLQGKQQP